MQFSIITVFALVAAATATPHAIVARAKTEVLTEDAAMTDKQGNVVPFKKEGVYQANKAKGL